MNLFDRYSSKFYWFNYLSCCQYLQALHFWINNSPHSTCNIVWGRTSNKEKNWRCFVSNFSKRAREPQTRLPCSASLLVQRELMGLEADVMEAMAGLVIFPCWIDCFSRCLGTSFIYYFNIVRRDPVKKYLNYILCNPLIMQ